MTKLIDITGKAGSGEWGMDDADGIGIPVLRTTNFTNEGIVNYDNVITRTITKRNIDDKFLMPGDIIIEKSGGSDKQPVGRVIFFDGKPNTYLFNNFTGLLRVRDLKKWLPRYVFYALFANYRNGGTRRFENKTTGLHNLKIDDYVSSFEVADAEYAAQISICRRLDRIAEMVQMRKQQLQKLDELIKARFVEMFGDPETEEKYPLVAIGDFSAVVSGGTPDRKKNEYWENGSIPWVKTTELQNKLISNTEEFITEKGLDESSARIVPKNTVLIAMYGQGKTRGMTGMLGIEAATNQACACILPSDKIEPYYLWRYMMLSYDRLRNLAQGGNQPNLNGNMIKNFRVLLPPIELQKRFVEFSEAVDNSKAVVQNALDEAQLLFDSLMQKYFG